MAAYQKPLVLVYQEFERVSPALGNPDLSGCIVGSAYNILTYADDKAIIQAGFMEFDVNHNVSVPRATATLSDSVALQVTGETGKLSDSPGYILTFKDILDWESQYEITVGNTGDVGIVWGQNDQNLVLTYLAGTDPIFEMPLAAAQGDNGESFVRLAKLVHDATVISAGVYTQSGTTLTIDSVDFAAAGVVTGDTIVLTSTGGTLVDDTAGELGYFTTTIAGVSTVTLTLTDALTEPDGTLEVADGALTGADAYVNGCFYIYRDTTAVTDADSIILQTAYADSGNDATTLAAGVEVLGVEDQNGTEFAPDADGGQTPAFGTAFLGGNYVVWDDFTTTHDPFIFPIPNPDGVAGQKLVAASSEVVYDAATIITAGGIGRVVGKTSYVDPTDVITGTFADLAQDNVAGTKALTTELSGAADALVIVADITKLVTGAFYKIDDGVNNEVFEMGAINTSTKEITNATGNWSNDYAIGAVITFDGFDVITHNNTNFEELGILPEDILYVQFPSGEEHEYVISELNGAALTLNAVSSPGGDTVPAVFQGVIKAAGTYYSVDGSEEGDFETDLLTAGNGFYHIYRGDLNTIYISSNASDSLVDAEEEALLTFSGGLPVSTDLGFLAPHINVEAGDKVYISRTTTGAANALNATYQLHRVFDVATDRIILTSPIEVPIGDRSTASEITMVNQAVQFYIQKAGIDDVVYPITGYTEDADNFLVTINNASVLVDPRYNGGFQATAGTGSYISIDDDGNVTLDNPIKGTVLNGITFIGSTSLRTDLAEQLLTFFNTNEIEGVLGKIVPENPLAFGVFKCLQNTVVQCNGYAIDYDQVNLSDAIAEATAYQKALDFLTGEQVYGLVPLTRNTGILGAFKAHVEQMSTPEKGLWRILMVNQELPTTELILDRHGAVSKLSTNVSIIDPLSDDNYVRFQDSNGTFVADGVSPGQRLDLYWDTDGSGTPVSYTIDAVLSQTLLRVTTNIVDEDGAVFTSSPTAIGNTNYEVVRELGKTEQAQTIAATSTSYNSRRVFSVWPDTVDIGGLELPGYYLGCVVAGMVSGLPAHQGFTRFGIAGIDGLVHSKGYFNEIQLDIIASGGTYVFVQDSAAGLPYSRHQLSTDRQFVETQELSITKNFDFMSYFFKGLLEPFIGTWNVTNETLSAVRRTIESGIAFQEKRAFPRIGAALRPGVSTIRSIEESSISSDRIEVYVDLGLPRPLNVIGLHLVV